MRRFLIAWLLLCAAPAFATQDAWPALYDVVGVAAADVLNVRAEPEASAPIIGTLAPDATGIELVRPNDRQTWALVNVEGQGGWVSLRYLARQPGQWLGAAPKLASCSGTEPFWALAFLPDGTGRWSVPGRTRPARIGPLTGSDNRRDRFLLRGHIPVTDQIDREPAGDFSAVIRYAACSDGMSDRQYGLEAEMFFPGSQYIGSRRGNKLFSGCCTLQRDGEPTYR